MSLNSRKLLLSFFLFFCLFIGLFSRPQQVHAQWIVIDPANLAINSANLALLGVISAADVTTAVTSVQGGGIKQFLLDTLATGLARAIVQGITAQTVNWINSGFSGNPGFVTNPQQFFTNIADYTVSTSLNTATGGLYNKLCTPFAPQIRLALVNNYLNQNLIGQCSLGQIANNYSSFINNFTNGGWESWFSITQNQQNNPYGAFLAAQDELQIRVNSQSQTKQNQLTANAGFLNFQSCTTKAGSAPQPHSVYNSSGNQDEYQACIAQSGAGSPDCNQFIQGIENLVDVGDSEAPAYPDGTDGSDLNSGTGAVKTCQTVTPGSVISTQLGKVFGSGVDQLNVTQSINQIANALITKAFTSVVGVVTGGLRSLGSNSASASNPRPLGAQLQLGSTESNAQATQILNSTTANVPGNLQYAAGLSSTPPAITPIINEARIQEQVDAEKAKFKAENPLNGSGATDVTTGTTGGTPSSICPVPANASPVLTLPGNGCARINTQTCVVMTFSGTNCADPLGPNEEYLQ